MRTHPRRVVVAEAEGEIREFILKAARRHDLTDIELLTILSGQMASTLKYALRAERHPDDPSKPADAE